MKTCTKCMSSLSLECFAKRSASKDGYCTRCKWCMSLEAKAQYVAKREQRLADVLANYAANRDAKCEYGRTYYRKNRDACAERVVRYQSNKRKTDPEFATASRARVAKRRAGRLRATPAWANFAEIKKFYRLADALTKQTGVRHEVDHVVPLQSPLVCGLHNQFNLQVLPLKKNRTKSNKHWPDMP